jgi:hypothetical protein
MREPKYITITSISFTDNQKKISKQKGFTDIQIYRHSKGKKEIKIMMNEYKKMSSEELVQAVGGLSGKVSLNCQAGLDQDFSKAVSGLQSGWNVLRTNSRSFCENAKDKIGQLYNSDAVQNVGNAALTKAAAVSGRLYPPLQRG